ncbi:MAG: pentapeptide repeat-containing protein [Cyanobacteria bacterium P01_D01_bin.44]
MPQPTLQLDHQNLQGRSFKGQNLAGADLSHSDLRGADFSHAILTGANLSHVKSGQQRRWVVGIGLLCISLAAIAGLMIAYASGWIGGLLGIIQVPESYNRLVFRVSSLITLVILIGCGGLIVRRGLGRALSLFATVFVVAIIMVFWAAEEETGEAITALILQSTAIAAIMAGTSVGALAVTVARLMSRRWAFPLVGVSTLLGAIAGISEALSTFANTQSFQTNPWVTYGVGGVIVPAAFGLSWYISTRALAGDRKYLFTQAIAVRLSSLGGTRFREADLSAANLSQARLKRADLRDAHLKQTRWHQTQDLNQARVEGTYLANAQIRKLVVTQQGTGQIYDRLNLRGLNLVGADLQGASLIGVDLSETDLRGANLDNAKLAQAQFYGADLTGVTLTGAFIENWGISTDTRLNGIRCDYVYMQLPSPQDPDPCRKPDNRQEIFQPGDFEDFIAPIIKTLDLYQQQNLDFHRVATTYKTIDLFHHQGIDPSAAAMAMQQLVAQHPEAGIEVIALEGRGHEKIRLQAKVSESVDRSQLSAQYFENYGQLSNLPYSDLQSLLAGVAEKDEQIRQLGEMLEKAIQQPRFYVETYENTGDFVMSQSKGNIQIGDVQGNVSGLAAAGENLNITSSTLGEVSGTVTQTINQLGDTEESDLKALLQQLQTTIETAPELDEDDKIEALEQVQVLAEAAQQPEAGPLKKMAKTAIKILKGTSAGVPKATELVQSFNQLLPEIATLLALM